MRSILILLVLLIGCATTNRIAVRHWHPDLSKTSNYEPVNIQDSILFTTPIINFCVEKSGDLLVTDASQEKVFVLQQAIADNRWRITDTVLLPQKIYFLKGIASDNIFIYLFTDNSLYRFDRTTQKLLTIISPKDKIKIFDLAVTSESEIFISDDLNNQIFLVNSIGKIEKFNKSIKGLFIPAGVCFDNQNSQLWAINQAQKRIEIYSRIGNIDSIITLADFNYSRVSVDKSVVLLWNELTMNNLIIKNGFSEFKTITNRAIANAVVRDSLLLILDKSKRIYIYRN